MQHVALDGIHTSCITSPFSFTALKKEPKACVTRRHGGVCVVAMCKNFPVPLKVAGFRNHENVRNTTPHMFPLGVLREPKNKLGNFFIHKQDVCRSGKQGILT